LELLDGSRLSQIGVPEENWEFEHSNSESESESESGPEEVRVIKPPVIVEEVLDIDSI
jgi:hypothetical protein